LNKIAPEARNILVIVDGSDVNVIKSFSNIENVKMDRADGIFAYEILRSKCLVMTEGALKKVEEVFANEK
jgi:ribosomal protein L4